MDPIMCLKKTAGEIANEVAMRLKRKRKALKLSQKKLAEKSGVSLGSIKRFETVKEIAFTSLIKLTIALELENEWETLFTQKQYSSIEDIIHE